MPHNRGQNLTLLAALTPDGLVAAMTLDAITAADARGWFRHCGYPLPEPPVADSHSVE